MAFAKADDGTRLHFEEAGAGTPIVFVHEFGGDHRSWEPQLRCFARRHRCVSFAARGYPPSDVPRSVEAYSQRRAVEDIVAVMDAAGIDRAHVVGLSMGGFAVLHFGLDHAERARSIVVAGAGYGAEKQFEAYFREVSNEVARQFETQGSETFAKTYSLGASRVQFQNKDPRGWAEFARQLQEHSPRGQALTMRGVQMKRPSLWELTDGMKKIDVPTLIVTGDEDDPCLEPGLLMKRSIAAAGLAVLPHSGHTINIEEPEAFNRALLEFFLRVDEGRASRRDPRSSAAGILGFKK